jgi:hypothetical protein
MSSILPYPDDAEKTLEDSRAAGRSSLDVCELLGDLPVAHAYDVHAADVAAGVVPAKHPADHGAGAGGEDLLGPDGRPRA